MGGLPSRSGLVLFLGLLLGSGAFYPSRAGVHGVPLFFAPVGGGNSDYLARVPGFAARLKADEVSLWLRRSKPSPLLSWSQESRFTLRLLGARSDAVGCAEEQLPTKLNFLKGRAASGWQTGVPTYSRVRFAEVYPGVDAVYYGNDRQLEYDFVVAPGVDPAQVRLAVEGARSVTVSSEGDLVIRTGAGEVRQRQPVAYQTAASGAREGVSVRYRLQDGPTPIVSFQVGAYDRGRPLVIDPVVVYAAYLGGTAFDICRRLILQSSGRLILVGETASENLPTTNSLVLRSELAVTNSVTVTNYPPDGGEPTFTNVVVTNYVVVTNFMGDVSGGGPGYQYGNPLGTDAMIAGLSADGQVLEFCTYLGGSAIDAAIDVAENADGSLLVYGLTQSPDFPVLTNAWVRIAKGIVCVTNVVDGTNEVTCDYQWVNTWPIPEGFEAIWKPNISGTDYWGFYPFDAFLTHLSASGDEILFSLYQGDVGDEQGMRVAVGPEGRIYTLMLQQQGNSPPWVVCMQGDGLVYSRPAFNLPPSQEHQEVPLAMVPTANQELWMAGRTASTYPLTNGMVLEGIPGGSLIFPSGILGFTNLPSYQATNAGRADGILERIGSRGETLYLSYLGGLGDDWIAGLVVNDDGGVTVAGNTTSLGFPTESALASLNSGYRDLFVTRLDGTLTNLVFSTYLGGSSEDYMERLVQSPTGDLLLAGWTLSTNFPTAARLPSTVGETKEGLLAGLAADGSQLRFATLVGGIGNEEIHDVVMDGEHYYWIAGLSQGGLEAAYGSVVLTNWWKVVSKTNEIPPRIERRQPAGLVARLYPGEAALTASLSVIRDEPDIFWLTWPALLPDYLLQATDSLSHTTNAWRDVSGAVLVGTNWVYTVLDPPSLEFFRLERRVTNAP